MRARLAVVLYLLLFLSLPILAQKFAGTIRGLVTDKTGAVVPGADVNILNNATRETRTVTTNQDGEYVALELNPGTYTVTVKKPNFSQFVSRDVVLNVSSVTVVNAQLAVGSVNEQVAVEAGPLQIETTSGAVGNVIEG